MSVYVDDMQAPYRGMVMCHIAFFERLHARFMFTMDGAASEDNALLPLFSTAEYPQPWKGRRVFCNPPWGSIPQFLEYAPEAELAVFLVPARVNAKWFHRALELGGAPEFFCGKLKFGDSKWNSPVDCLLIKFGAAKRLTESK